MIVPGVRTGRPVVFVRPALMACPGVAPEVQQIAALNRPVLVRDFTRHTTTQRDWIARATRHIRAGAEVQRRKPSRQCPYHQAGLVRERWKRTSLSDVAWCPVRRHRLVEELVGLVVFGDVAGSVS
jgi:hypothetical protein